MKKRKRNNILFVLLSLLTVAALVALPFLLEEKSPGEAEKAIVSSAVKTESISKTLSGTGTLTAQDAADITLPSGVEITRYIASNGDIVSEGDALAYVDRVTVLQAISSCQATLSYLEEQMTAVENEAAATAVTAPAKGEVLTVYAKDGDSVQQVMLEHGALAVLAIEGKEWKAQAYTGTVSYANAREGSTVYPGTTLFYLEDTTDSSSYDLYAAQHREYEELMQQLSVLYQDGVISASCSGAVADIDEEAAEKLQAEYSKRYGLTAETAAYNAPTSTGAVKNDEQSYMGNILKVSAVNGSSIEYQVLSDPVSVGADMDFAALSAYFYSAYGIGEKAEKKLLDASVLVRKFSGAEWIAYSPAKGDVLLLVDSADAASAEGETPSTNTYALYLGTLQQAEPSPSSDPNHGNNSLPGTGSLQGMTGASGFGGMGGSSASARVEEEEEFVPYPLEGSVCMTVTPQETISISITVDELDVLSVHQGAEAKLTIDALPGREYTGTVTGLDRTASNNGGNTKYAATITFERDATMLPGMNASSLITVSTREDILTLPAEALTEDGADTLVYTSYDEKAGQLGGVVKVTTGVSDGAKVQILSGLSEGDVVYYAYEDSIELESLFSGMPGGGFGSFTGGGFAGGAPAGRPGSRQ